MTATLRPNRVQSQLAGWVAEAMEAADLVEPVEEDSVEARFL